MVIWWHWNVYCITSPLWKESTSQGGFPLQGWMTSGFSLTHWGWVMHICVGNLTIIGSDNGLSPDRRQAIIWINAEILLIGPLGTNFSEILIEILTFSFKKMHLKRSSAKRHPFCLGLIELKETSDAQIWCFLWCRPEQAPIQKVQLLVISGVFLSVQNMIYVLPLQLTCCMQYHAIIIPTVTRHDYPWHQINWFYTKWTKYENSTYLH